MPLAYVLYYFAALCRSSYAPLLNCINGTTSSACIASEVSFSKEWYTLMPDHTATWIPQGIDGGYGIYIGGSASIPASPSSNYAMTNFPFYARQIAHWAVGALDRWEVDDWAESFCK